MNILSFGASYSKNSINKKFAIYILNQFTGHSSQLIDLNAFPLPVFTVDNENQPDALKTVNSFLGKLDWANYIIISMAEHNGSFTAAFKNLFDWASNVKLNMFEGKKMLLLSTSTGKRGGLSSLNIAKKRFPKHGAAVLAVYSLPTFQENFDAKTGITNRH